MSQVTFDQVSNVFNTLEGTSSRNEMTQILADFFKDLKLKEAQILSYFVIGRVAPSFVDSEFDYSEKSFISLLNKLFKSKGLEGIDFKEKREELGDIGDTLEYYSKKLGKKTNKLSLVQIYEILWQIVNAKGTGSIEVKNRIISETLKQLSPLEAKYFSRIVCGSLRFGLSSKTLLDVFSFVVQGDKGMKEEMERAYGAYTDIGYICSLIVDTPREKVIEKLHSVKVQPGTPILPRLVERVSSFEEVFERLGDTVFVQSKYDGLRCQIHKFRRKDFQSKDSIWQKYIKENNENSLFENTQEEYVVRLFTRNLEDVTEMFPEIVEQAKKMKEESFIMDSELLGWNTEKEEFLTFQETMQRRRKYNVKKIQGSIPVKAMVFDLLYLNGNVLLGEDLVKRLGILREVDTSGGIEIGKTKKVRNLKELREIFDKAVKLGLEGIIVKQIKGGYLPGVRNYEWIKLKKSMLKGLVDTIDLVVVGYNFGSGRRSELGVGSILGASYNEKEDLFETVCNVGTGFTDEQLKIIYASLKGDILEKKPKNVRVDDWLVPDVWVEPRVVFTVEADEITQKKGSDGFSLRFPRLVEWGREKGITEATTIKELGEMYEG